MLQIIAGRKGKGKTKQLLEKVNTEIKSVHGNIVYLDKSSQHMYELNNKVRLIDTSEFPITDHEMFLGFVCGILSQDHDLEQMYLDSFLKIARIEEHPELLGGILETLKKIGEEYRVTFVLSISMDQDELPESVRDNIIVSL